MNERAFNVLMLGAGVQSSTLLYMSIDGFIPRYDLVVFADTGDEPKRVYKHVEYLHAIASDAEINFRIVKRGGGSLLEQMKRPDRFVSIPVFLLEKGKRSVLRRQCTAEFKIIPAEKELRSWLLSHDAARMNKRGQIRVCPDVRVNKHLGISLDEKQRVSLSKIGWMSNKYPLIDMKLTRSACIEWCGKSGYPIPPKSSCKYCPYHSDDFWEDMFLYSPEEFEEACQVDDFIRSGVFKKRGITGTPYLHPSCKPLREVVFKAASSGHIQLRLFEYEAVQSCNSNAGFTCFS